MITRKPFGPREERGQGLLEAEAAEPELVGRRQAEEED
jgi:hypothetical protein